MFVLIRKERKKGIFKGAGMIDLRRQLSCMGISLRW